MEERVRKSFELEYLCTRKFFRDRSFFASDNSWDNQPGRQLIEMAKITRYQSDVNRGLSRAYQIAESITVEMNEAKWVIFSDLHKGTGDLADDFQPSISAYTSALEHYFDLGHVLVVLGDVEELWENTPGPVLRTYPSILELESKFHMQGRYVRFWGNHDDEWQNPSQVKLHLWPFYGKLSVLESLRIQFSDQAVPLGELFLVHGHQGTLFSDRLGLLSRIFIRYIWRPIQRIFKIAPNTPADDSRLRHRHDIAMYNWSAVAEGLVLIAGHTHHPIFPTIARKQKLEQIYETVRELSTDPDEIEEVESDLAFARAQTKPSYMNSGCCCFNDGRITGIELANGMIRLVRWPDEIGRPNPEVLDELDLRKVFERVRLPGSPMDLPSRDE